jgi:hypothetical protein
MDENKMVSLLLQLADLDITALNVYYEGGGDSGAIERIVYSQTPNMTWEDIMHIDVWGDTPQLDKLNTSLYSILKDFAQEKILEDIEDWWNDEGGYGYLCIKVPSGEYKIFNKIYIQHTEDYEHEGDLINKTLE